MVYDIQSAKPTAHASKELRKLKSLKVVSTVVSSGMRQSFGEKFATQGHEKSLKLSSCPCVASFSPKRCCMGEEMAETFSSTLYPRVWWVSKRAIAGVPALTTSKKK